MFYNRQPERNVEYVPHIQRIVRNIDGERLAISPQLNLKLERGSEMGIKLGGIKNNLGGIRKQLSGGSEMKTKETVAEVPREIQSRSLLHHKVGVCPQCEGDMYVVSTKKAFGKANQACECVRCHYSENR